MEVDHDPFYPPSFEPSTNFPRELYACFEIVSIKFGVSTLNEGVTVVYCWFRVECLSQTEDLRQQTISHLILPISFYINVRIPYKIPNCLSFWTYLFCKWIWNFHCKLTHQYIQLISQLLWIQQVCSFLVPLIQLWMGQSDMLNKVSCGASIN